MGHKFFLCENCGNLTGLINNTGARMECCCKPMKELTSNSTNGSLEKHLPVVSGNNETITVTIGENLHPMIDEHHIKWVYLQTEKGGQRKSFDKGSVPSLKFSLASDKPVAVFAYCNVHGLWEAEIK